MADHKQDILTTTGSHRAWIGERVSESAAASVPSRPGAVVRDNIRNWNRPQNPAASGNSRHAAITRTLANFPSYKSWTEKVKTTWQKDKPGQNDKAQDNKPE